MSCNCSRFLIALNSTTMKARWPIIGATTFRIILHQKLAFQRIHPIRNKPWKSSKQYPGLSWGRNFCGLGCGLQSYLFDRTWSLSKNTVPIIITGWSQMVVSKMGQVLGMETASEHEMYPQVHDWFPTHWVKEYQIDGFRFDLMGIHDVRTMNAIRRLWMLWILAFSLRRRLGHGNRTRTRR